PEVGVDRHGRIAYPLARHRYLDRISSSLASTSTAPAPPPCAEILGIPLAISDYEEVLDWMEAMIASDQRGYVTAAAVNLVMKAQEEPATMEATLGATLAVPDGQPPVWALKALGHSRATRIYGPDLMAHFCARAARQAIPMYLYGGRDAPARELLTRRLNERFPGIRVVRGAS